MKAVALVVAVLSTLSACGGAPTSRLEVPSTALVAVSGPPIDARQLVAQAPLTVIVFFSRECHCLTQHDGRLRDLYAAYHPRGVAFAMIDPEVRASPEVDAAEAAKRGYPFPLLIDHGAHLANALDAQYATYSVIVNAEGHVLYRGGIDSDKTHLKDTNVPYLRNALDDLLAGRTPRLADAKTLGCSLQKW